MTLPWLLGLLAVLPLASLMLTKVMGRAAGWPLGVAYLAAAALLWPAAQRLNDLGEGSALSWSTPWVSELRLDIALRLDGLSLIFVLMALIIGAVVFFYSTTYFTKGDQRGFYLVMTAFTFAMVAFVLSDNLVLLFLTWELTSIASFLLIARSGHAGEAASMRTLLLTFIGGLALLAAVALIVAKTGSSLFSEVISSDVWAQDPAFTSVVAVLVAVAGFSKAAQFPFHFWLPDAMAAATPVSAYLHAAAVVKAGIYLLFRFTAVFHATLIWNVLLISLGLFTACLAGFFALQQTDLKKLMAYSTVSQLGLITATIGVGTEFAIAAALLHTIAHACFKSGLFMLVGIIDHQAGTRSLQRLPALRRSMPLTFWCVVLGTASMAGAPPMLGFVSKENVFAALLDAPGASVLGPLLLGVAAVAAVLTFLYCGKIVTGAFIDGPAPEKPIREAQLVTLIPAAAPVVVGVPLAFVVDRFEGPVDLAVVASHPVLSHDAEFTLWHGLSLELFVTLAVFLVGTVLVLRRGRLRPRVEPNVFAFDGAGLVTRAAKLGERAGGWLAGRVRADHPAHHVGPLIASLTLALGAGSWLLWRSGVVDPTRAGVNAPADLVVLLVVTAGVLALVRSGSRLGATVLLGGVGITVTAQIFFLGAPDVGLTQLLVEILSVLVIMLVLRKLPVEFGRGRRPERRRKAVLAIVAGGVAAFAAWTVMGRRERSGVADYYLENAHQVTGGDNIVNVILVEFRALDTFGELAVLGMAGVAIIAVLATIPQGLLDPAPDPDPDSLPTWVPPPQVDLAEEGSRAHRALEDVDANTEPLRLLQRVLIPSLLALSAMLFWRGHNDPGGGFIAALVAACAVAYVHLARSEEGPISRPMLPVALIAGGVLTAIVTGALGLTEGAFLEPVHLGAGGLGVSSSLVFDVGVYAAVLGLVMVAFNVLGDSSGHDGDDHARDGRTPADAAGEGHSAGAGAREQAAAQ
ncbi:MAG: DUF4040 family protein [Tetrasphaera sp.]|nr:DUF4040 family protein [Tetrasphaera sp.]